MKTCLMHTPINPRPMLAMSACRSLLLRAGVGCSLLFALGGLVTVASAQKAIPAYGKLPLSFEPNRGQTDAQVQFLSRGPGFSLFLTPGEAVLSLSRNKPGQARGKQDEHGVPVLPEVESSTLRMQILGADTDAAVQGQDGLPGTVSYFEGTDKSKWKTAIPTYKRVSYKSIYPGVDLVYYGNQRELEYDFVVAPGGDPQRIALGFKGATPQIDNASGDLVLATGSGETRFHKPVVYQMAGDRRVSVEGSYQIANGKVGFALGRYDRSMPLVIDPVLSYLTYLGGSSNDIINGIAIDSAGSAYVVGTTTSTNFPTTANSFQPVLGQDRNQVNHSAIFVSKVAPDGKSLVYSTYLQSGEITTGNGIAVDSSGSAYVVGFTTYTNYPITAGAFQTICGGNFDNQRNRINGCVGAGQGDANGVLTKLSPNGQSLVYSTYLGGNDYNTISAVAVNAAGEAYVTGVTNAFCNNLGYYSYQCFPTTSGAAQTGLVVSGGGGNQEYATFTKFNAAGSALIYSTLLGNTVSVNSTVSGLAVAVDAAGNGYITGSTSSGPLLTTPGSFQPTTTSGSPSPAFVAKFDPTAQKLVYSTYLGELTNNFSTTGFGIATDASGNAYVTGETDQCGFPTTPGAFQTQAYYPPGPGVVCHAGFVTKVNPAGSALVWSTLLGGQANSHDNASLNAIALGSDGSVYVGGHLQGYGYPSVNPIQAVGNTTAPVVVSRLDPTGSSLLFSSTVSGTAASADVLGGIAVDAAGNIYVAGSTDSLSLPTTPGAIIATNTKSGNLDEGFVAKIAPTITTTTTLTLPSGTLIAGQPATFTAKVSGPAGTTSVPTGVVTFSSGSTTLGTGTLDATGTASYTATSLNATTYNVTASYPGDSNFSPSVSAAQSLIVVPAVATVTLTAPATATPGASVTLSVKVTGSNGTPTGSVTFKDGSTVLSTVALASGAASYSTSMLAAGAHSITASYGGDSLFAAAVSGTSTVTINVAPGISFAAAPTLLTIVHGTSGSIVITGTPVGGYTGTVTFACGTLPTAATCVFIPTTLSFTGTNTPQFTTLTLSTVMTGALELPTFGRSAPGIFFALLLPLSFLIRNRRKGILKALLILVVTIGSIGIVGLSGCAGSNTVKAPTTITTPAGAYSIPVTITASGNTTTLNIAVTVQ